MFFVYIVRCADRSLYTGVAKDVQKRIHEHNSSTRGAKYTRSRRPVTLVYAKQYPNKSAALRAEYALKQYSRKEKLLMIAMLGAGKTFH